ncbi:Lysine histidine transporter-like 8 [Vitis vinifera]|uniref:Lysine histidine transporter-like 8 n=1 Tax=Vitis vinifera TaxID=29760 RepID=A0A438ET59_VITVI|nr:Lysine histidine transporter-like 8 [Vitis vinifera]
MHGFPSLSREMVNAYYSAFHSLSSGDWSPSPCASLGFHYTWLDLGNSLSVAGFWMAALYSMVVDPVARVGFRNTGYSRYLRLSMAAFANGLWGSMIQTADQVKSWGSCWALFPTIVVHRLHLLRRHPRSASKLELHRRHLTHRFISAVTYCTVIWVVSVTKDRPHGVSYDPVKPTSDVARLCGILNALGIIAFAFRGHNLVLEIQGTMPSSAKHPSRKPMWSGVKFALFNHSDELVSTCS